MADSIMKQAYSAAHLVEQVGARMTKYALSDNKEDLKKNPLKFVAKKLVVLPYGAVVRSGGAVLKTMTNPLYPIQSIKRAWQKRNNSEKHQSMVINHQTDYKHKEVVKLNPTLSSSKEIECEYNNSKMRLSAFKHRVAEMRQDEGVSVVAVKNPNETGSATVSQQGLLQKAVREKLAIKR